MCVYRIRKNKIEGVGGGNSHAFFFYQRARAIVDERSRVSVPALFASSWFEMTMCKAGHLIVE